MDNLSWLQTTYACPYLQFPSFFKVLAAQSHAGDPVGLPQASHLAGHPRDAAGGSGQGADGDTPRVPLAHGLPVGAKSAVGVCERAVRCISREVIAGGVSVKVSPMHPYLCGVTSIV